MSPCEERLCKISGVVVPTPEEELEQQWKANRLLPENARPLPENYRVYLVNEGNYDLATVEMYTGGFAGEEDTVVELNRITRSLGPLSRGGYILIEPLDYGILDYVLWYHFDLRFVDNIKLKAWFSINKGYSLRELRYSSALNAQAYYFPLSLRRE
jgi:hypothetical protein